MADRHQRPFVEPQRLTGEETGLYELVATFEYQGRPMTQGAIAEATGLDSGTVADMLERLTERNVLVRSDAGGETAYALARRDWSAAPGLRRHFPPGHGAEHQEPGDQMPGTCPSSPEPEGRAAGRMYRQEARAEHIRAEHLRAEQERGEQARAELERHPEADGRAEAPEGGESGESQETGEPDGQGPEGATVPQHLMPGPEPQGRVRNAPGTLIARAEGGGERPARARFVANTVPGKPDGEVDTRS
jgi:hypothetical protein